MNPRYIYSGLIGAALGTIATYLIMDRLHSQEITELYGEMDEMNDALIEAGVPFYGKDDSEVAEEDSDTTDDKLVTLPWCKEAVELALKTNRRVLSGEFPNGGVPLTDDVEIDEDTLIVDGMAFSSNAHLVENLEYIPTDENQQGGIVRGDQKDGETPEEDDDVRTSTYNGIFIIQNDQVTDRMVVGVYDHNDGSLEINKSLSIGDADQFDDIIENDALYSLINEEAYDILMNSKEPADIDKLRVLAIRNNVINLDFVIRY